MSRIKETRTVSQEVAVAWQCDVCYTQIADKSRYEQEWFHFSKSHQGWGNDSADSWGEYDVCSIDCFIKQLQESIPDLLEYSDATAEIADMPIKFAQKLIDRLLEGKNE